MRWGWGKRLVKDFTKLSKSIAEAEAEAKWEVRYAKRKTHIVSQFAPLLLQLFDALLWL